ncbi:hypothetical protein MP638_006062, partial [Amoeboaphelidium occidentale]
MNELRRSRRRMNMAPSLDDDKEDDDEIVIDVDDESSEDRNNNVDDDYVEDNESEGAQEPAVFVQRKRRMNMAPSMDDDKEDDAEIVIDVDVDDESIEDRNNNVDDDYVEDNESEGAQEPAVFVQREYEKISAVSCGLRGLVKNKKQLYEGRDIVLMTTGLNGKLRHFFTALLTSRQINYDQDVLRAAEEYRALADAHEIDFGSTAGIISLLNNAVLTYEVELMNGVTTTIHGRILRWLRHMLDIHCSVCFRNKKRGTAGAKYIMSYLAWQANDRVDKPEFPLFLDKFLAKNYDLRAVVLAALLTARVELFSISYASEYSLSKDYIKENWYKYFGLLFHVLSRLLERRCRRGLRRFTLAPLKKMRNGFILVDTTSLGEILAFAYARGRNRVPRSFPAKKGYYSKESDNLTKLRKVLERCIEDLQTVGVSARVHFTKTCFTTDLGKDGFKTFGDKEYVQLDVENKRKTCFTTDLGKDGFKTFGDKEYVQLDVENKRVFGLDPGRKDIFSCFDGTKA